MSGFVAVVPAPRRLDAGADAFSTAMAAHERLFGRSANGSFVDDWVRAASFARANRSGACLIRDERANAWVIAVGTWFHPHGFRSGQESRLLARYLDVGAVALARELEGFFCLVFGDGRTREVAVVTDIVGSCHAFMSAGDSGVVVATSSLVAASVAGGELDPVGCQEFLAGGVIYEDRTCFRKVRKLGPACVARIGPSGAVSEERYWDLQRLADEPLLCGDVAVERLWEATTQAARQVGNAFERPVCDLTGGYDSRAMLAAFLGAGLRPAVTVSGATDSRDVVVSKGIAAKLGLEHIHCEGSAFADATRLDPALRLTDGEYDAIEYARVLGVHEQLRTRFDVSINGSFGEVARGYWWELLFPRIGARVPLDSRALARARFATGGFDASLVPASRRLDLEEHFTGVIDRANEGLGASPNTLQMDNTYLRLRMQRWQGRIASSTDRLWPCISPFMFRSVLEIMLKVDPKQRLRSLLVRQVLSRFQPDLAAYPLEHGYPAEPATWRNVARFAPVVSHYSDRIVSKIARMTGIELRPHRAHEPDPSRMSLWNDEEIRTILDPARMRTHGLIDPDRLQCFLAASRLREFAFDGQWARLLTLEAALRVLEDLAPDSHRSHNSTGRNVAPHSAPSAPADSRQA